MKKLVLSFLSFILCLQIIGCTNNKDIDTNTVVWRIATIGNLDSMTNEMIKVWEKPLNELLKDKNAPYQVKIISYSNKGDNSQINDLKELQKNDEQTDIITLFPENEGDDMTSWNNIYKNAVDNKLLLNLDKWKEKNQKILEKVLTSYDFELSNIDNKLFGISSNVPVTTGIEYNKELLDRYGIDISEIKSNIFDNEDLLMCVKNKSSTIPIQYMGLSTGNLGLYVVNPVKNLAWKKGEGFISISKSEEFKQLLHDAINLKKQGLLDQTYIEQNGFIFATMSAQAISKKEMFNVNFEHTEKITEFVTVPDYTMANMQLYWGDNKTGIASWSKNIDNAEDFLLKLYTDKDIANLIQYGIEGQDYQLDDNNHITVTTKNIGLKVFGAQLTNPKITYSSVYEEDDKVEYSNWFYTKYGDNFPKGFRFEANKLIDNINATNKIMTGDFTNEFQESEWMNEIAKLEIDDLDTFLKDMNKELDKAGMQKIVDEANRQYQEWLKGAE